MDRKDEGQTHAIQWTEKKKHKHWPYNGKKKTKHKHRSYNEQKRQRTNTGNTIDRKDKGQTQAIQ